MENKFTAEQIEKAKKCKTVEELRALAKENGITLAEGEAICLFARLSPKNEELSTDELNMVAAGSGSRYASTLC